MIGYITGTIKAVRKNYIIIATDYLGYKVFVIPQISLSLEPTQKISLFIYTHVREDQLALYGFATMAELELFEILLSVSGIGPRLALAILSLADVEMIKSGIVNQNPEVFTKVSGVGRKTAERLIIELREKIGEENLGSEISGAVAQTHADVVDVLMALGYSRTEARNAVAAIPSELATPDDKIREALRLLAKQ